MGGKHRSGAPRAPSRTGEAPAAARSRHLLVWLGLAAALLSVMGVAWLTSRPAGESPPPVVATVAMPTEPATFVGSAACASCHAEQHAAWTKSQHARAMQHASADTVRGDFNDAKYSRDGVTSTFLTRDGRFYVRTDGPDGKLADFEIKYTFGVEPLQQYLVELPGGRLQALSVTWDTRPERDGGQRWFRQYPDEKLDFRDELHWTRGSQNWNFMCADCHSTDVRKNYDDAKDAFNTQWSELTVGCESCHGPASAHLAWARTKPAAETRKGLTVALDERRGATWQIDAVTGNASRSPERRSGREIEVCAQCHARRAQFAEGYRAGQPFMDHYLPSLLSAGLYHADGQQRDEVFIWGSFLQSKMQRAGVTCSDCHDPHTQKLRIAGNGVCAQCHLASKYDASSHHLHPPATRGAQCVSCHMPSTDYMVIDARRDHSFRIPRPDLSVKLGTPNACSNCHRENSAQWAAEAVVRQFGPQRRREPHFGEVFDAAQRAQEGSARGLVALINSAATPAIVRASAIELLAAYPGRAAEEAVRRSLLDADPLVRHAAVVRQQGQPAEQTRALLVPLLRDPIRAVRIEAARALAPFAGGLDAAGRVAFDTAIVEFEQAQRVNLDRPEAWLNLGNLYVARGETARAEQAYRRAIKADGQFVPAFVNLADLQRAAQRESEAEAVLREGLKAVPSAAALREALGLSLVRQGRKAVALEEFAAALKDAPDQSRYAYVYAMALLDAGRRPQAIEVLAASARRNGGRDVLLALAATRSAGGDQAGADQAMRALAAINPDDPALR